jgi:hypothetical protein
MTELLSELLRSPVAGDREVAQLLGSLRAAEGSRPRASEALAAFIAERGSGLTTTPAELPAPAGSSSLLVVLGGAADPKPARRRVVTGAWANMAWAAAAAIVLVAVAVAPGGASRDVVVRPTDSSSTVAPATTGPADQADPTPRRHHPARPRDGSRPHRPRIHPAATASNLPPALPTHPAASNAAAGRDEESARASDVGAQPEESGDDRGDETARGTDDGGDTSDGGAGDGRDTPDGMDD